MPENRRFLENKSLFLEETHMVFCSASRVQRMLSIQTCFEGITRVFFERSSILTKTSGSVREMHENRRFFENKSLFLQETHMVLCSATRVQRMLSIADSIERITRVFRESSSISPK